MIADIVLPVDVADERLWVPQAPNIWFRPLLLDTVAGQWVNALRVRRAGVLNRHRHPAPVYGYVLKGSWRYLEHDWVARTGSFVFEPPGVDHTLVVDDSVDEMITLFHVAGAMIYLDAEGRPSGYEDVFTKIELCRAHYEKVGLGADFVKQFVR